MMVCNDDDIVGDLRLCVYTYSESQAEHVELVLDSGKNTYLIQKEKNGSYNGKPFNRDLIAFPFGEKCSVIYSLHFLP